MGTAVRETTTTTTTTSTTTTSTTSTTSVGCKDKKACNYDAKAQAHLKALCKFPKNFHNCKERPPRNPKRPPRKEERPPRKEANAQNLVSKSARSLAALGTEGSAKRKEERPPSPKRP